MVKTTHPRSFYEQDLMAWYEDMIAKLKTGNFSDIDLLEQSPSLRDYFVNSDDTCNFCKTLLTS